MSTNGNDHIKVRFIGSRIRFYFEVYFKSKDRQVVRQVIWVAIPVIVTTVLLPIWFLSA